jgi:hypothetical protein
MLVSDRADHERYSDLQHRQKANASWWRRRRQIAPVIVFDIVVLRVIFWRRRERRRPERVEGVIGLRLVKTFILRRRRQVLIRHRVKIGRRLVSRRDHRKTPARIRDVRAVGITAQISPIRMRGVGVDRSPPEIRFTQRRENGAHAWRLS